MTIDSIEHAAPRNNGGVPASRSVAPLGWLPLARWNLRYNPFGELTREQRIEAAVVDIDPLVRWLAGSDSPAADRTAADRTAADRTAADRTAAAGQVERRAVQLMGDCGRGKTTHLLAILSRFSSGAYVYLPEAQPTPAIPIGNPLLIDEAQRLSWWVRRSVFRRGVPLVLGTHVDLHETLTRHGYTVRSVDVAARLHAAQLREILNRRIALARLGPGGVPEIDQRDAARLIGRFGNDVRAIERYLYEQLQRLMRSKNGKMRFVD